jgi:hypothetical protein
VDVLLARRQEELFHCGRLIRISLALAAVVVAVTACGGKHVAFTFANWGILQTEAHTDKYNGAHVDITGQIFLVDQEQPDSTWFAIYADPKNLTWETIVEIPRPNVFIHENQIVHVVGVVDQKLAKPSSVAGFDIEPVILASSMKIVAEHPG